MEAHFSPEVEAMLARMARESGRPSEQVVEDAVVGYFDELAHTREMLDRRYDDLESGRVKPIGGEEFFEDLRKREDELLRSFLVSTGAKMISNSGITHRYHCNEINTDKMF